MKHHTAIRLRKARELSGLSMHQAARKLGVSHSEIALAESGAKPTDDDLLAKLAEIYEVTPAYLRGDGLDKICPEISGLSFDELAKLSPQDLETVLTIIASIREQEEKE